MKFKEKASTVALATILVTSAVVPTYAALNESIVGANRYETAAKVADNMGEYSEAILVNGNSIADGLAASSLAGKKNAPILLVKKNSIPQETLQRLYNVNKVYIIGKEGAISSEVETSLNQSGIHTKRIGGDNRIETSIKVAEEVGNYSKVFLVNGVKGEADAMSISSVAAREKAPIILTNGKTSPIAKENTVKYYVVGGKSVMTEGLRSAFSAERLSGSNRYATNKAIVEKFYPNNKRIYFAKGDSLVDALAVSPLAKGNGVALVSENSNKSLFYGKEELVQVGGMSGSIVDKVNKATYLKPGEEIDNPSQDSAKPDNNSAKPDSQKTYGINSPEFQKIVRDEFYRLLDAHRAANGRTKIKHHWAFEESAMAKSKHMIDNKYFGHYPWIQTDHVIGGAECIAGNYVVNAVTREEGVSLGKCLFEQWRDSEGHNRILLGEIDENEVFNGHHGVDGFAFYAKKTNFSESFGGEYPRRNFAKLDSKIYMIKATYHSGVSDDLMYTDDTTNEFYKPGMEPKN